MQKNIGYQRRLATYGLGIAGCGAALATGAGAAVVDVTFDFGPTLDPADGFNPDSPIMGASVGNIGFDGSAYYISLFTNAGTNTGFYHDSSIGAGIGLAVYQDNTLAQSFGNATLPDAGGTNAAYFHAAGVPAADLGADATGVIGFRSTAGNWGWIEFSWEEASSTLTVNRAQVETVADTPINFTPIPEPSTVGLLSLGAAGLLFRRRRRTP